MHVLLKIHLGEEVPALWCLAFFSKDRFSGFCLAGVLSLL